MRDSPLQRGNQGDHRLRARHPLGNNEDREALLVIGCSQRQCREQERTGGLPSLKVIDTWKVGGSPDMMQLNWDGTQLWVSNQFNASVSVIDTTTGKGLHVFHVGTQAHGLTYFLSPGDRCTGHNGVYPIGSEGRSADHSR